MQPLHDALRDMIQMTIYSEGIIQIAPSFYAGTNAGSCFCDFGRGAKHNTFK
jgi:hypothetical protein